MSTSRPMSPVVVSDTSSEGGSLSDLESGWTDLETNRSSNGRHSPLTISDAGDSEDARSATDRFDLGVRGGLITEYEECDVSDDINRIGLSSTTVVPSRPPLVPELTLEDWVADAVGSSLVSDDDTSTPHLSLHSSSSPLRLSFPDPLSSSDNDLLPSHALRARSQRVATTRELRSHSPARTDSLSSVTARSASATTPSDASFSVPDDQEHHEEHRDEHHEALDMEKSPVELAASPVSYALSIVLLGHPPLLHLKRNILSTVIDIVATAFGGNPSILEGSETARIYEVPISVRQPKSTAGPEDSSTYRVIVEDRTFGMSSSSSLTTTSHGVTLALVFIQPPLSPPSIPSLSLNTRYIPLLLPSISDTFVSSLLDLSPSALVEHSVPEFSATNNAVMKSFALNQCKEMGIDGKRLDASGEVLTVEQFSGLPTDTMSNALKEILFPSKCVTKEEPNEMPGKSRVPCNVFAFRKQVAFISALIITLIFGSTVLLRASPSAQGQKFWSFILPSMNRTSDAKASSFHPTSAVQERALSTQPLVSASLKSLAGSIFLPASSTGQVASTSRSTASPMENKKAKVKLEPTLRVEGIRQVRPATIDPASSHLTIDAPSSKSLSLLPQTQLSSLAKGKGKNAVNTVSESYKPFPTSTTSLSTRISNALAPLLDRVQTDMQEILDAIDALLQELWRLQQQTSHGIGSLIHMLSEHWQGGQGVQGFADKVHRAAKSVSEKASRRHALARHNAMMIRDIGQRYLSVAGQGLKSRVDRARENVEALREGAVFGRSKSRDVRAQRRAQRRKRSRARGGRKVRCSERVFETVMGLVA